MQKNQDNNFIFEFVIGKLFLCGFIVTTLYIIVLKHIILDERSYKIRRYNEATRRHVFSWRLKEIKKIKY